MQKEKISKWSGTAIISFFASLAFCYLLIGITIVNSGNFNRVQMEQLVSEQFYHIEERLYRLFHKTESLAALVAQGGGNIKNFEQAATFIVDDDAILNVLVAPGGVVEQVYPLRGNEAVIGLDFFADGAGNKEAIAARDTGKLVLGGPFTLVQGGQALVGRKPVYIDGEFWGIVSVTLKFPKVIQEITELEFFEHRGFDYELWRISPDTNERQIISGGLDDGERFFEKRFDIINSAWYLKVAPFYAWYNYSENIVLVISGLFISFLVFLVMQNNYELKHMRYVFENMAKTDPLTGIHNRRHFMEMSHINLERSLRLGTECYVVMFDLDKFKSINDTHGHLMGDFVIMEVVSRIKALIRPYDLFARYGGEEFIIFATDINKQNIMEMVERIRLRICREKFKYKNTAIDVSASFGIAFAGSSCDLQTSIKNADEALYKAKDGGRNRIVIHNKQ